MFHLNDLMDVVAFVGQNNFGPQSGQQNLLFCQSKLAKSQRHPCL